MAKIIVKESKRNIFNMYNYIINPIEDNGKSYECIKIQYCSAIYSVKDFLYSSRISM
jgi:hypothetical protein